MIGKTGDGSSATKNTKNDLQEKNYQNKFLYLDSLREKSFKNIKKIGHFIQFPVSQVPGKIKVWEGDLCRESGYLNTSAIEAFWTEERVKIFGYEEQKED